MEDRPKRIRLELFPYDNDDVDAALSVLASHGFIRRYEAGGVKVIEIANFLKHQGPHGTEKDCDLPDEAGAFTVHDRDSKGYVRGKKRVNNVIPSEINVNPPLMHVEPTLDNTPIHRFTES